MLLVSATVGPFKSINTPQTVSIDEHVTVLVGMNEAGKTVFLQALEKARDILGLASYEALWDYPRKDYTSYCRFPAAQQPDVTILTYRLTNAEVTEINELFGTSIELGTEFTITYTYSNEQKVHFVVDETPVVERLKNDPDLSTDAKAAVATAKSIRDFISALEVCELTESDKKVCEEVTKRCARSSLESVVEYEVWNWISPRIPKFLYFGEYDLLPSEMNLVELNTRLQYAKKNNVVADPQYRAIQALLRMAEICAEDFATADGYEVQKAKIEAVSINLTDRIMGFWKQNEDLEVEVDIKADPTASPPLNNGPNLYLRIKNRRHRGVSTPFRQRSRGFIWFFSFLVWFDQVQRQIGDDTPANLIILLDEPGLNLHALAQSDFLKYIDNLAERHQVLYTTHSPFMVHSDRLHQVRIVEDVENTGTVISEQLSGSNPSAIFPLQAALGWTIAQNLFISERNLLVEGPSELIYLKIASGALESLGRTGLRTDVTIVPAGGLDKVATFIALLGASGLKLAVLHDFRGAPEQRLADLAKQKVIPQKSVLNVSQFRDLTAIGKDGRQTDIEDLFDPATYVEWFNAAFASHLELQFKETDLPAGDRIIERIERHLIATNVRIRPSGGFNHYTIASHVARNPSETFDEFTLKRFEHLFNALNELF